MVSFQHGRIVWFVHVGFLAFVSSTHISIGREPKVVVTGQVSIASLQPYLVDLIRARIEKVLASSLLSRAMHPSRFRFDIPPAWAQQTHSALGYCTDELEQHRSSHTGKRTWADAASTW